MENKNKKGIIIIVVVAVVAILLISIPLIMKLLKGKESIEDMNSANEYLTNAKTYYDNNKNDKEVYTNMLDKIAVSSTKAQTGIIRATTDGNIEMAIIIDDKCYKNSGDKISKENNLGLCGLDSLKTLMLKSLSYLESNGNGCKTPGDNNYSYMGGCYQKGKADNNYVWYSGFLWRIMGMNADESIKLISAEELTTSSYNNDKKNEFVGSYADDWLNHYLYNKLKNNDLIIKSSFCIANDRLITDSNSSVTSCNTTSNMNIGLITLDEYNLAGASNSYLNIGANFWTATSSTVGNAWTINENGEAFENNVLAANYYYPVININKDAVVTTGNGIYTDKNKTPFVVNDEKKIEITDKAINDKVVAGDYVKLSDKTYRVVNIDNDKNVELVLNDIYEENNTVVKVSYGENNDFNTNVSGKLNGDVLKNLVSDENKDKLVNDYKWNQKLSSLDKVKYTEINDSKSNRVVTSTVGLPRIGEIIVSNKLNGSYWTMNVSSKDSAYVTDYLGFAGAASTSASLEIRPVIVVKKGVKIVGGTGIPTNPYQI